MGLGHYSGADACIVRYYPFGFQEEKNVVILALKNRNYLFPGAGRKIGKERFIVMEDVPHAHAGDLRHRLWSDGTIDFYYSWETQGDPR